MVLPLCWLQWVSCKLIFLMEIVVLWKPFCQRKEMIVSGEIRPQSWEWFWQGEQGRERILAIGKWVLASCSVWWHWKRHDGINWGSLQVWLSSEHPITHWTDGETASYSGLLLSQEWKCYLATHHSWRVTGLALHSKGWQLCCHTCFSPSIPCLLLKKNK